MVTKFVEATQSAEDGSYANWGKFMLARFEPAEWATASALSGSPLLLARGWVPNHLLFLDIETGEGTMLSPGGSASADLAKHRVWVCPLAEPFLEWLYDQDLSDLEALPSLVELPDAPFSMAGYRRNGGTTMDTDWVVFAQWSLGEVSDGEYADHLASAPDYDADGPEAILVAKLRESKKGIEEDGDSSG